MRISKEPDIRKKELIETALKLFLDKGYEKTSIRDILREVKGSPGMFYYYFSSKEEIFESAIQYYVENYIQKLSKIFQDENLSLSEKYNNIVNEVIKAFEDLKSISHIYFTPQYFPLRVKIAFKILDGLIQPFSELIDKFKKDKNIDSKKIATFILYGVYGILHQNSENQKPKDIQEILNTIYALTEKILNSSIEGR
ncbi:MAG: TetR family transcriptional regulator [Dictyoglomus sp. NZ13-RE01]|nr:MAG: TetR family transcriptional regulator [Dictyoglomus sp. NZ13-RE01]